MPRNQGCKNGFYREAGHFSNQNGIALVAGLLLMVVLTLLSFVAIKWASQDITQTKNYATTIQATYIAEAGINKALDYFNYTVTGASPGEVDNGFDDELSDNELNGSSWPAGTFNGIGIGADGGTYTVTVTDNNDGDGILTADVDNSVILTSTGTISGTTVSIEAVIHRPLFKSEHALLSEGDVTVSGGSNISGTNGSVHTNSSYTESGASTSVQDGATATGTCSGAGTCTASASVEYVPVIEPSDYESYADYIFNADGSIYAQGTVVDLSTNTLFSSFTHNNLGWKVQGNTTVGPNIPNQANLYFKDDFTATSVGDATTAWEVTLIVEKSIKWTGNAYIKNWEDPALTPDLRNLFLIAGNDISMSSMEQDTQGLIAAKDQASIAGGATLSGSIITNNTGTTDSTVTGTGTTLTGGITLVYNGDLYGPETSDKVAVLAWQKT